MTVVSHKKKVFVGLSGGVDSSVSAALLKQQGYDVEGVFIKVWQPDFLPCTAPEDRRDAMRVCAQLDIPFRTLDLEAAYKQDVVEYMVREYEAGRTPNPDVMCNRHIKFGAFLKYARKEGADFIATGHYAQNIFNDTLNHFELWAGKDDNKDQSYFLWTLTAAELKFVLFPIGHFRKSEVRALARKFHLPTAEKKDSQGLCFIGKLDLKDFLGHFLPQKKGNVINDRGEVIGEHDGALFYTLGQRHGFVVNDAKGEALYVVGKNVRENTVTVSLQAANARITSTLEIENCNWITKPQPGQVYKGKTRYRQEGNACTVRRIEGSAASVDFVGSSPISPPGQSFVAYEDREGGRVCIGGGVIS